MTTITVHGFKDGTGKSLVATNLAYYYSKQGQKTLLIDGDLIAPSLESYFPPKGSFNSYKTYLESESPFEESIVKSIYTNLYICYTPLPSLNDNLWSLNDSLKEKFSERIATGLDNAREEQGFEKIIIDNTSGINFIALNQLAYSDQSILVVRPARYDIETSYHLTHTIFKKLSDLNPSSKRKDFLVWNQVPLPLDSKELYTIHSYIADWTEKFTETNLTLGTSIPYSAIIAIEMVVYTTINLVKISRYVEKYIDELINKLDH
ncbi:MAG: ParA family protein [Candidatus Hodarchaeales archaeon]